MVPGRAGGSNRTSCGIVLIGPNPLLRKRIGLLLRAAGFQIEASVPDTDLPFLGAIPREHQIVSILEVNNSFEEMSCHLKHFTTLFPTGSVALFMLAEAASPVLLIFACAPHTNLRRARKWSRDGEAVKSRYLTPEKGRRSIRAGKGVDGISENAASWRAMTPAATAGERPTARQAMILKSLMNGDSNKAVARRLRIAEETVKVHIKRLLRRIGVKNRTQAAIWALNNNFTPALVSETGDLRPARSLTKPRSALLCAEPKTEFGAPPGPPLSRSRGGKAKSRGRTIWKRKVAKYH
jgi:two-component system nitrate/nitrite response regulator NarL